MFNSKEMFKFDPSNATLEDFRNIFKVHKGKDGKEYCIIDINVDKESLDSLPEDFRNKFVKVN